MSEKIIKVYRVKLVQGACPYIARTWPEVLEHLRDDHDGEDMSPGEVLSVEVTTMDEAEVLALPEWDGP